MALFFFTVVWPDKQGKLILVSVETATEQARGKLSAGAKAAIALTIAAPALLGTCLGLAQFFGYLQDIPCLPTPLGNKDSSSEDVERELSEEQSDKTGSGQSSENNQSTATADSQ